MPGVKSGPPRDLLAPQVDQIQRFPLPSSSPQFEKFSIDQSRSCWVSQPASQPAVRAWQSFAPGSCCRRRRHCCTNRSCNCRLLGFGSPPGSGAAVPTPVELGGWGGGEGAAVAGANNNSLSGLICQRQRSVEVPLDVLHGDTIILPLPFLRDLDAFRWSVW